MVANCLQGPLEEAMRRGGDEPTIDVTYDPESGADRTLAVVK